MADILDRKVLQAGASIFREGDEGTRAYLVQSGEIEIWRAVDGGKKRLGVIGPGGIFGEMALIDRSPRMASATALTDTTVVVVSDRMFEDKLKKTDPFVAGLLRILVRHVRSAANK